MRKKNSAVIASLLLACSMLAAALSGCGGSKAALQAEPRQTRQQIPELQASGTEVTEGEGYLLDYSNTNHGYLMLQYSGQSERSRMQIQAPDGLTYTYPLRPDSAFSAFPLQAGSGSYRISILEQAYEDYYALLGTETLEITVEEEFGPFLYPNRFVWFTQQSEATRLARELSERGGSDIDFLTAVYHYVTGSIRYDEEKAANVSADYVPDIDQTLASGKGICFDYASLMAGMLRSQGIPTRLVVGYAGTVPHAWISVWLEQTGWLDRVIEFDGREWKLLDPTLAAANDPQTVKRYINDKSNYTVKYYY